MKRYRSGKYLWQACVVVLALLVIILVMIRLGGSSDEGKGHSFQKAPHPVKVCRVERGPIRSWVFGEGTARAVRREYLTFEQAGKVTFIKKRPDGTDIREGDRVKGPSGNEGRGEVLAIVDDRDFVEQVKVAKSLLNQSEQQKKASMARLEQAEAQYEVAKKELERKKKLFEAKTISQSDFELAGAQEKNAAASVKAAMAQIDAASSQIESAKAQLEQANVALERTRIHTPFDGIIAYLNIREGYYYSHNLVSAGSEDELLKSVPIVLIDPSQYEITLRVPFYEGGLIGPGQDAYILRDSDLQTLISSEVTDSDIVRYCQTMGKVYSVTPAISPGERSIEVKIRTTNGALNIRDGQFVMCWIVVDQKDDALIVPMDALLYRDNQPLAFAVDEKSGTVEQRVIGEGLYSLEMQEITSGATEGDLLVTEGKYRLVNGAPVEIIEIAGEKK